MSKHDLSALSKAMVLKQEASGNQELFSNKLHLHGREKEVLEHPEAAQACNNSSTTLEALLLQTVPCYNDRSMVTPAARDQNHEATAVLESIGDAGILLSRKPKGVFDTASRNLLFAPLLALQPLVSRPRNWSWPHLPSQSRSHASQHDVTATTMPCATSFASTNFGQSPNNQEESTLSANERDALLLAKDTISPLHQRSLPSCSFVTAQTPINGNASLHRAQNLAFTRLNIPGMFGAATARAPSAQLHLAQDHDLSSCITPGRSMSTTAFSDPRCLLLESAASMVPRALPIVKDQAPQNAPFFGGAESFPMILHRALAELELVNGGELIATFLPDGKTFQIRDQMRFELQVLPLFFPKMKAFGSFQRQLNLYDFYRVSDTRASRGTYSHPLFLRDFPILSSRMKRTKIKGGPARGPPRKKKKKADDNSLAPPLAHRK